MARAGLPLSMVRLSTPARDRDAARPRRRGRGSGRLLARYLRLRGLGPEPCSLLVGASGMERFVEARRPRGGLDPPAATAGSRVGGVDRAALARDAGSAAPDLRDALWDAGYAVDTLETAVDWSRLPDLAAALGRALRHGLDDRGERVHAFSHLSHLYPTGRAST